MTDNRIKEQLSRNYVNSIAHLAGVISTKPDEDYGADIILTPILSRQQGQKKRFYKSPYNLDIQLKSTTVSGVKFYSKELTFKLEAKNYNDLIVRRAGILPLYLILVIFDHDPPDCIKLTSQSLTLNGRAFWYTPSTTDKATKNGSKKTIKIPLKNQLSETFVNDLLQDAGLVL